MSSHVKTIVFAAVLSIVCGSLLTLASTGLKEYQLRNIELDKQKNILKSVGLIDDRKTPSSGAIEKLYANTITPMWIDSEGKIVSKKQKGEQDLAVYLYLKERDLKEGGIRSYIIPVDCRGLWGRISGYLAIKNDGATVEGFTVYSHSETPGLGGEIAKRWFQKNFEGKRILDDQGNFVSVTIAKGSIKGRIPKNRHKNFVDGISGASLTGKFLSAGLKNTLGKYEPVAKRFRKNEIKRSDD